MHKIFTPLKINGLVISNRFIRSATMDNMGDLGMVTDRQVELYKRLGEGEIGLIISHGLFPSVEGQGSAGQLGVHKDSTIASLSRLVDVVHDNGGKIAAQILHCGFRGRPEVSGLQPVGPSTVYVEDTGQKTKSSQLNWQVQKIEHYGRIGYQGGGTPANLTLSLVLP